MKRAGYGTIFFWTMLILAGMGARGETSELTLVKWATAPVISAAPTYVAMEKGYFRQEGLDVQVVTTRASDIRLKALIAGDVQLMLGGFGADIINAVHEGAPVRIVADSGQTRPGFPYGVWLVRADLWESGAVRSYKDLKGKVVGHGAHRGSVNDLVLRKTLAKEGISPEEVTFKRVAWPQIPSALAAKSLEVAQSLEPFTAQALGMGAAKVLGSFADAFPEGLQQVVIVANTKFGAEKPQALRSFMKAYLRGVLGYHEAITAGKGREELFQILTKFTRLETPVLSKLGYPFVDPTGRLNEPASLSQLAFFFESGVIRKKVERLEEVADYSHLPSR